MQTFISSFTSSMSWLMLGLALISVALLGVEAWRLRQGRCRAFVGLAAMLVVISAGAASLIGLRVRTSPEHSSLLPSTWILPLVASTLLVALYHLVFPLPQDRPSPRAHLKTLVLLFFSLGVALGASGLGVLDFLFS